MASRALHGERRICTFLDAKDESAAEARYGAVWQEVALGVKEAAAEFVRRPWSG